MVEEEHIYSCIRSAMRRWALHDVYENAKN